MVGKSGCNKVQSGRKARSSVSKCATLAGMIAGAVALVGIGRMAPAANADTVILYSTQGDFITGTDNTNFSGNAGTGGVTVSTVSTVSSPTEGGTVNGILNGNPGGTGTAGALAITLPNGMTASANYAVVASTSYLNWGTTSGSGSSETITPSALVNALDSGGTLTLQYTVPTGTSYLNPPLFLINYPNNYVQLSGTASSAVDANGFYTDTISLAGINNIAQAELSSSQAAGNVYLTLGIILNGVMPAGAVVNVSNIEVQTPVPEPATFGLFALGGVAMLLASRKRRKMASAVA